MILPLKDAVEKISAKTPIGSALRSAEWLQVPVALRERAQFSAGVTSARVLQTIQERLEQQIKLEREKLAEGREATFDRSSFIDAVRDIARDEGLTPEKGEGGLTDITSIPRLGLIYDMQNRQAAGYARWKMDQSEGALLLYPAWEFVRVEDRRVPRDSVLPGFWDRRWLEAAAAAGDEAAARIFGETDRKVALKTSGIWSKLSIFGTPWMPFDWGSGMGVEEVDRETAIELGLLKADEIPEATGEKSFNEELQASVRGISPELKDFLKESFGGQVKFEGDAVWWKGDRAGKRLAVPKVEPVKAAEVEVVPAPPVEEGDFPAELTGLTRVKELGGSTGAALVRDRQGRLFVLKKGNSAAHVREEFLADQMYEAAGAKVPKARLYTDAAGNPVKLAQFVEGKSLESWLKTATAEQKEAVFGQLQQHFHIDAVLANWDVAGMSRDNILVDNAGNAWRIDNGGSLRYRAQGQLKTGQEWGNHPLELWTLRDAAANAKTAEIFKGADFYQIAERIRATDFSKLVEAAPEEVRGVLQKRVENIMETSRKALEYKEAQFVPQHADRVTEEIMRIRQAGIPDILSGSLSQEAGDPATLKDSTGRRFNHLRTVLKVGAPAPTDPSEQYYQQIVQAVKTVNGHHAKGDTSYNVPKLEAAAALKPTLENLMANGSPAEKAMASKYLETLAEIEAAKGKKEIVVKQFSMAPKVQQQAATPAAARSAVDALADHMRARGADWKLVEEWAEKQAGSSKSQESRKLKRWLFERLQGLKGSDFHALPAEDVLSSLSGAERQKYDRTFEVFNGFVQEVLGKMDFPANDRAARVMRVLRSETTKKAVPFGAGESGVYKRGVNESGSLYTQFSDSGANTETVVPHARITSIYFLEQKPGSGITFLLGDSENEVTYMAHGLKAKNVGSHTPKANPGTDSTKWETRW